MANAFLYRQMALSLTLGLGIGLSILATTIVNRWETANRQLRFQRQIENLATGLQRSLNRYTDLLAFLGDYYATEPTPVNRQAFAQFVERSLQVYPGIQALEWAPLIQPGDRLAYEQRVQSEGYPNFQITELGPGDQLVRASQRSYYIPVTYVEPLKGNEFAFGFDLNSHPTRATAINQARDTGQITATARIRLVQEQRNQFSFLVFLPLYQQDRLPPSLELRRQQFVGVLLGVFRLSDVVEESLQGLQYEINVQIYDRSTTTSEQFLGQYDAMRKQVDSAQKSLPVNPLTATVCPTTDSCKQTLTVGQRQWSLVFSPSQQYLVEPQYGAIATLLSGLLLTSGLVLFLHYLNRELAQTQQLSELRSRFFSMASHELRTPLSTILLSSESLQVNHEQLSDEQKQASIQRIYLTAKRMSQQIADLLMITRAEAGKLEFQPELLDLQEFCQQIVEELQMGITQPIKFLSAEQPIPAFLDKKLVRSLLTNLLSNAAKYSPIDSPIQITLSRQANLVIWQIRDRGIGIPEAEQSRIQEPFYRASNVGEATGTGLGLAIVNICVELHRGSWAIASQVGEGTTVTISLPLE